MDKKRFQEFEEMFNPHSVAVVGSFSNPAKGGYMFLWNFIQGKYPGKLYAVSNREKEAFGLPCYRSLSEIPGPVDYVIVCIPAQATPELMDECARKGVKTVQMYTAGFSETATAEGRHLEAEITTKARAGGFHIIGPNCVGIYNPAVLIPPGASPFTGEPGDVAILSQSGTHTERIVKGCIARKLGISKAVSFGNGCDLDSVDYIEYFGEDPQTKIIGAYLEGIKDGRRLFDVLRKVTKKKPVVLLKGGRTITGASTAASHTGSMTSSYGTWHTALKQAGVIETDTIEELLDTLVAFDRLPKFTRGNIALVAGMAGGGGGDSVITSDLCLEAGLNIVTFSEETQRNLREFVNWPGVITRNPVDLSGAPPEILERALSVIKDDSSFDVILAQGHIDDMNAFWSSNELDKLLGIMIKFTRSQVKPMIVVFPPGLAEQERLAAEARLSQSNIAVFPSTKRAIQALVNLRRYYSR